MNIFQIWTAAFVLGEFGLGFDFEVEVGKCMAAIYDKYFQDSIIMVYDMRDHKPYNDKTLLPPPHSLNMDRLIGLASLTEGRQVITRDHTHDPTLIYVNPYNIIKATASIFVIDEDQAIDWPTMDDALKKVKENESFLRQGNCLLLIHNRNQAYKLQNMSAKAIASIWRWNKAINVVAMIVEPNQISFYHWIPYRQPYCSWIHPQKAIEWWRNGSFQTGMNLYPVKNLRNLDGCPLRMVTDECAPYTWVDTSILKNGRGIESRLVDLLQDTYNFTFEKIDLGEGESLWETNWPNNTPAGAFASLNEQKADIAFGCIMLNEDRNQLAEPLPVFYQDSLSWMIPTPVVKSHESNVFDAFPVFYWMAVAVALLVSMLAFILILKLEEIALEADFPDTTVGIAFRIFAMGISSPIAFPTRSILVRATTFLFAMYALHITTTYQASLYQLYKTTQYLGIYRTLSDVLDSQLFFYLRGSTKNMYNQSEYHLWKRIMKPGLFTYYTDELEVIFNRISKNKTAVALYIKSTFLSIIKWYYTDEVTREPSITYLQEQFASYPVAIFLSPGSPLVKAWSNFMYDVSAGGLVNFWLKDIIGVGAVQYKRTAVATDVSLRFEHITGAFLFYGIIVISATIIFAAEFAVWIYNGKVVHVPPPRSQLNQQRALMMQAIKTVRVHKGLKRKRSVSKKSPQPRLKRF